MRGRRWEEGGGRRGGEQGEDEEGGEASISGDPWFQEERSKARWKEGADMCERGPATPGCGCVHMQVHTCKSVTLQPGPGFGCTQTQVCACVDKN